MSYRIYYSCVSHIGLCRKMNQDNIICDGQYMQPVKDCTAFPLTGCVSSSSPSLFGIFDGMGGEERGEMAAFLAAKKASAAAIGDDAPESLARLCLEANEEICRYAQDRSLSAMGTTAAMLAFTEKGIALCNIGDSKIFRFSGGMLQQISQDHVGVSVFGRKPPLSQNLGIPPSEMLIEPYLARGTYISGDRYLICSDGLTDMLGTDEIGNIMGGTDLPGLTQRLLDSALTAGGRDNISIIACKIERDHGKLLSGLFKRFTNGV